MKSQRIIWKSHGVSGSYTKDFAIDKEHEKNIQGLK